MPDLIDANVTTRSGSGATEPNRSSEEVAHALDLSKRGVFVDISSTTIAVTFVPSHAVYLETGSFGEQSGFLHEGPDVRVVDAWASVDKENWLGSEPLDRLTRATRPTSTTVSSVARLLRRHHRDERLCRMSPDARATYERIRQLREEIGPIDFDVVEVLRELRDDE